MSPVLKAPLVEVRVCVAVSSFRTRMVTPGDTLSDEGVNAKFLMTTVTELAGEDDPPDGDVAELLTVEVDAAAECELPQAASIAEARHRAAR